MSGGALRLLIDKVPHRQRPFLESIQLDRLDASLLLAEGVEVMTGRFMAIDDALAHFNANFRLLLRPHAFQHLPGIVLWFADVLDAQAVGRDTAVVTKKTLLVTPVPAVDLTVQKVLDSLFVHTHVGFILG
jgi:hypothetical protein